MGRLTRVSRPPVTGQLRLAAAAPRRRRADPQRRRAAAYRSLTDVTDLSEDEALDGEDVLPGFRLPLADVLA